MNIFRSISKVRCGALCGGQVAILKIAHLWCSRQSGRALSGFQRANFFAETLSVLIGPDSLILSPDWLIVPVAILESCVFAQGNVRQQRLSGCRVGPRRTDNIHELHNE